MTKQELMDSMSSVELSEWVALNNLRVKEAKKAEEKANRKRGRL